VASWTADREEEAMHVKSAVALIGGIGLFIMGPWVLAGCGQQEPTPVSSPTPSVSRTLSDFAFLQIGMTYEEVIARVGPADRLEGSGVTGYAYDLSDGSKLSLNFGPMGDALARVLLMHPDGSREILLGGDS